MVGCRPTHNIKSYNSLVLSMWGEHCSGFNLIGRKVHQEIMSEGFSWLPSTQGPPESTVFSEVRVHTQLPQHSTQRED